MIWIWDVQQAVGMCSAKGREWAMGTMGLKSSWRIKTRREVLGWETMDEER